MAGFLGKWFGLALVCGWCGGTVATAGVMADGEDLAFDGADYWNGADAAGGFASRGLRFRNRYNSDWGSWSGFAYSRVNDTNTPGWFNQYAVISGTGAGGGGAYLVGYDDGPFGDSDLITLPRPDRVRGVFVNNTTYAALDMAQGSGFSKKFGGADGTDPDWFKVTITGRDALGQPTGQAEVYLADFRFADPAQDYIVKSWTWVDLRGLGSAVKTLEFALSSSDNGSFGMNTPAYFALDNLATDETYAPAAGLTGSTAVEIDDAALVRWATGWTNYSVGANCDPDWQNPSNGLGLADGTFSDIVCLGDGGAITLVFDPPIADGPGSDFAVFENGWGDTFLELAFVEVSSDGTNFTRFPNRSLTAAPVGAFGAVAATNISGLGSKYRLGFGEPYDLGMLAGTTGLDHAAVRYVRILDIVGDGSNRDTVGQAIYDPYPVTGSAGFDLDAIGVLSNDWQDVYLEANVAAMGETNANPAAFYVCRTTWDTSQSLTTRLAIAGSAMPGADYTGLGSVVVIPAGQTRQRVELRAVWDDLAEGDETVVVWLADEPAYRRRAPEALLLTLADASPCDAWRAQSLRTDFNALNLGGGDYWNGADGSGGFIWDAIHFKNVFTDWGGGWVSWSGFAYSRVNDTNTAGFGNQYAVICGTDRSGTGVYAVAYDDGPMGGDVITLPAPARVRGFYVNNTTFAALDMEQGSGFSKQFGGATGDDPDWFKLIITGRDEQGQATGQIEFYLADFRFADSARDYIVKNWTWVDLTGLGPAVKTLEFDLSSSDNGENGMNTPAYFALDELALDPASPAVADDGDWNGDGVPNLLAYTSGRRIGEMFTEPPLAPVAVTPDAGGGMVVEFTRRRNLTDAALEVEVCVDGAGGEWRGAPLAISEQATPLDSERELVRALILGDPAAALIRLACRRL